MRRGFLDVAKRHAGVERGGDEGMSELVRADWLDDPGPTGAPPDDPSRPVAVETPTVAGDEDRPGGPLADGQVDRPGGARGEGDG